MEADEKIEAVLLKYPIFEYAFGNVAQIPFSERVESICQSDCERYGKCWSCPPYCGTFSELQKKCKNFSRFCMFSTLTETKDTWNEEEDLKVKGWHEKITKDIKEELQAFLPDLLVLSTGCMKCQTCTCPDRPCRFPDERVSSIESYGIVAVQLIEDLGLTSVIDADTIVYFSMVLYRGLS